MAANWTQVELGAHIADMQEVNYRNTLAIASLIELLVDKGMIEAADLLRKSRDLDRSAAQQAVAAGNGGHAPAR